MSRGLLLIDGSNIAHAANSSAPLTVGDMPTQAIYGLLRTMRPIVSTFSMLTPVVLWDGRSWRKDLFTDYKASRDKPPESKSEKLLAAQRDQFKVQLPFMKLALKTLGIRQMYAHNYEADDLAGVLIAKSPGRRIMMLTGDKDWIQLIGPNVAWFDPIRNDRLTLGTIPERLGWNPARGRIGIYDGKSVEGWIGVPSPRAWLEIKALMGDVSDDIPGVGGIGPKGAIELITSYGSVTNFINGVLDHSIDRSKLPKKLWAFVDEFDKRDNFQRNMMLMDLNSSKRPAAISLTVTHAPLDLTSFGKICTKFFFKSILEQFDKWCEPFGVPA